MGQEGGWEAGGGRAVEPTGLGAQGPQDGGLLTAERKTHGHTAQIKPSLSFLFSLLSVSPDLPQPLTLAQNALYLCLSCLGLC